jgi:predicted metal-dependent hydrolase
VREYFNRTRRQARADVNWAGAVLIAKHGHSPLESRVQFLFNMLTLKRPSGTSCIQVGDKSVPLLLVLNPRSKRYILRLKPDGSARVTIPRGGSQTKARAFAEKNVEWIKRQMQRVAVGPVGKAAWHVGSVILFRGEAVTISAGEDGTSITFADQSISVTQIEQDCRQQIERHLHRLAAVELPPRAFHFAHQHGLKVERVTVRNQKSRWGSCSRRGTISLNWRLIQAPSFVAEYVILHELMHLRQMNHSPKFWQEVENVCPEYRDAARWLKAHGRLSR